MEIQLYSSYHFIFESLFEILFQKFPEYESV